ncbi:hypothetical protein ACTABV_04780 [Pseudomonas fragariae (ex Marin et al. 2024)]|uniref:hypothetical protein n=1 Tax=Pseudomonas fragariae (ex Marin et al. 2024) TaxID=3080056 RepID=UPI003F85B002
MRSVKIRIPGSFWDSQIYSGELILLGDQGEMHKVDWQSFIDKVADQNVLIQTAIRVAFSDSDLFYNAKVRRILSDPHIEHPIKLQLSRLSEVDLQAENMRSREYWSTQESPFNFLPTDTEIYYNQFFAGGNDGLYSFPRYASARSRESRLNKHHDASIFQVKASERFSALATAAGNDGLFDFSVPRSGYDLLGNARQLASQACSACDWSFQSVMGWTSEDAFMANFREEKESGSNKKIRVFDRIIDQREIFGLHDQAKIDFVWGSREKIYKISDGVISVRNYNSSSKSEKKSNSKFEYLGTEKMSFGSEVIATGTAPFGTVLELNDKIIVMRSDGEVEEFSGEPVHWRIFPRSEHYSNQLHIVYEDYLDVISFTHDYFVNQEEKMFGFSKGREE